LRVSGGGGDFSDFESGRQFALPLLEGGVLCGRLTGGGRRRIVGIPGFGGALRLDYGFGHQHGRCIVSMNLLQSVSATFSGQLHLQS
jgi:hypothetical protein